MIGVEYIVVVVGVGNARVADVGVVGVTSVVGGCGYGVVAGGIGVRGVCTHCLLLLVFLLLVRLFVWAVDC